MVATRHNSLCLELGSAHQAISAHRSPSHGSMEIAWDSRVSLSQWRLCLGSQDLGGFRHGGQRHGIYQVHFRHETLPLGRLGDG